MMDLYLKRVDDGLFAQDEEQSNKMALLKRGKVYKVKVCEYRNYENHKRFFALMKIIFENQDKYGSLDPMRKEIIMRTGRYVAHHHITGNISYEAKSMAFDKMSESEFQELFSDCIDVAIKNFCGNMTEEQLWEVASFG